MAKNDWQYSDNQFLNATKGNYRLAVQLSNFHDAVLLLLKLTIPALVAIYDRYHPLHVILVNSYNTWKSKGGNQKTKTAMLKQALKVAYGQMDKWETDIRKEFLPSTPEYKGIFAGGRAAFTATKLDDRINAYGTLAENLEPYDALDPVRTEIEGVYTALGEIRDSQEGAKGGKKTGSGAVETARVNAMIMMWRNTGFAMDLFWDNKPLMESMFDLEGLRTKPQTKFKGTLAPSANHNVVTHTFLDNDKLRLKNTGLANVKYYLASTLNGINSTAIEVLAGETKTIDLSDFGISDYALHRFLTVVNQSNSTETHFQVEIK